MRAVAENLLGAADVCQRVQVSFEALAAVLGGIIRDTLGMAAAFYAMGILAIFGGIITLFGAFRLRSLEHTLEDLSETAGAQAREALKP